MNNFFSLKRFCRLFVKHTTEHYRTYLMSIAVLIGVIVLGGSFLVFVVQEVPDTGLQTAVFNILMLLAGTLFTSTVFADFGDKSRAIPALTLPASSFEKFLVGWVYSYPIFLVVYTSVYYLGLIGLGAIKHWEPDQHFTLFSLRQGEMLVIFVLYSLLHSIAIFGAILFRNIQFIKTGFTFFIGIGVLMIVNTLFLKLLTGLSIIKLAIPFGFLNFNVGPKYYSISTEGPSSQFVLIILAATTIFVWVAAYYRLKEKQV